MGIIYAILIMGPFMTLYAYFILFFAKGLWKLIIHVFHDPTIIVGPKICWYNLRSHKLYSMQKYISFSVLSAIQIMDERNRNIVISTGKSMDHFHRATEINM